MAIFNSFFDITRGYPPRLSSNQGLWIFIMFGRVFDQVRRNGNQRNADSEKVVARWLYQLEVHLKSHVWNVESHMKLYIHL